MAASLLLPAARSVGADPLGSARAQATQVEGQLQTDGARLDALSQQYEQAEQQLASLQGQIAQLHATIADDQSQVAADESGLRSEALSTYETGATETGLTGLFAGGTEKAAAASEYENLAAGDMTTAVDDLHLAQEDLGQQEAALLASEAQAQATVDQIAAARDAAASTAESEQSTLHGLNGQIAQLVDQQQAGGSPAGLPLPSGAAGRAIQAAESQIGVPYEWGAEDPGHGFDCSGLTQWSWGQAGVSLPRTAEEQYEAVTHVPMSAVEPGDLVFWGSGGEATHVAIYIGNGEVVHAPSTGETVRIQAIWSDGLMGAGQP